MHKKQTDHLNDISKNMPVMALILTVAVPHIVPTRTNQIQYIISNTQPQKLTNLSIQLLLYSVVLCDKLAGKWVLIYISIIVD